MKWWIGYEFYMSSALKPDQLNYGIVLIHCTLHYFTIRVSFSGSFSFKLVYPLLFEVDCPSSSPKNFQNNSYEDEEQPLDQKANF